jgi:hypothetical protein
MHSALPPDARRRSQARAWLLKARLAAGAAAAGALAAAAAAVYRRLKDRQVRLCCRRPAASPSARRGSTRATALRR